MLFEQSLARGKFLKRYKRFLVDVETEDGETLTIHCPNSGSMKTCMGPQWPVLFSDSGNPKRKLRHSMEMIHNGDCWIGINTHRANGIVVEAITEGRIHQFPKYDLLKQEVPYGKNSRVDILLNIDERLCYIEVKNVTLVDENGYNTFPDAVTSRGLKHLNELEKMVSEGHRAVMFYLVQRSDGHGFRPAANIDPAYAKGLKKAITGGVEVVVYHANVTPAGIEIDREITNIQI